MPRMPWIRRTAITVLMGGTLLCLAPTLPDANAQASRKELQDIEKKRQQQLSQRKQAETKRSQMLRQEKNIMGVVQKLDREMDTTRKNITVLQDDVRGLNRNIRRLERKIETLTEKTDARQQLVAERLRANYKINYSTPNGLFAYALYADNFSDLLVRLQYVAKIRAKDDQIITEFVTDQQELEERKAEIEGEKTKLLDQKKKLNHQEESLTLQKKERQATLETVRKDRALQEKAIKNIDTSLRQLNSLIARLQAKIEAEERAARAKSGKTTAESPKAEAPRPVNLGSTEEARLAISAFGRINWPVEGSIISNASHALEGITIRAAEGTAVKSVLDGTVEYAEWFDGPGFGKLIVLNHGKGYRSFYAHLDGFSVRQGQSVKKGQTIGTVGSTGSLVGNALYFEMRRQFGVIDFKRVAR